MEARSKIFIEPIGFNVLIRRTQQIKLYYSKARPQLESEFRKFANV
jgi:hypothetical protein